MVDEYRLAYQVACIPGPNAAARMTRLSDGALALVIDLDPVTMAIHGAKTRTGVRELADFCRERAHEAMCLAAILDPDGEPAPPETYAPRHALVRNEFGESGAGH